MVKAKKKMTREEMNGHFNFTQQTLLQKIGENTIQPPDSNLLENTIKILLKSKRIFGTGAGRSKLALRSFFMRLMHLGFVCYVEGETTTPAIEKGDCFIAITGSGETPVTKSKVEAAKKIGATVIIVTSFPKSSAARIADHVIEIRGRRINAETPTSTSMEAKPVLDYSLRVLTGENIGQLAPMGTLFEDSTMIFMDALVAVIMEITGQSEKDLKKRHDTFS